MIILRIMDTDLFYAEFGKILRELRRNKNLTQDELSQRVGLSRTSVTNIEKGRQKIPFHFVYVLSSALGVDPCQLLPEKERLFAFCRLNEKISKIFKENNSLSNDDKEWVARVLKPRLVKQGDTNETAESGEGSKKTI